MKPREEPMSIRHHSSEADRGSGIATAQQVRGSPPLWLFIHHTVRRLLRRDAADRGWDLAPGEIEERYKLLLACGF
jgi:hypothetical protein